MPKRRTTTSEPKAPTELLVSREEAKSKLEERIQKGLEIKKAPINSEETLDAVRNEFRKWDAFNNELLKRTFTTDELAEEYRHWIGVGVSMLREPSLGEKIGKLHKDIDGKIHRIDSIIERLELIPLNMISPDLSPSAASTTQPSRTNKVFIVHGHDEVSKNSLEVFLREIGLEPVVLHRQPDEGLTVIEKFEKHSDVGYAFILLTPDEIAYLKSEEHKPDSERQKEYRARPNVIFEFGFFVGKLGRSKVCCLYTGDVRLPSDVSGMIYKKYNSSIEEIAYSIIKDLKASGYGIA
jgi:predicted nucleotide-binding protein